jgi:hypothetical protein
MLNEINRREVLANLLHWMCGARNVRGAGFIAVTKYYDCIPKVALKPMSIPQASRAPNDCAEGKP